MTWHSLQVPHGFIHTVWQGRAMYLGHRQTIFPGAKKNRRQLLQGEADWDQRAASWTLHVEA